MNNDNDRYKEILDNLYDGVYIVDRERRINYWNRGAERISGFKSEQVVGSRCMDNLLNHVTDNGIQLCLNGCPLHATMADGNPREAEIYLHHADGHRVPVLVRTSPIRDASGEIVGAVESFSDNTPLHATRHHINKLEKTVMRDPVTGIDNRRQIELRLQSALNEFQQHRVPFGVLFIDIDYFKRINDEYGHEVGDRVLRMVANTLYHNVRTDDTVARWGGEEFLALLYGVDRDGLATTAEKLKTLVANSFLDVDNRAVGVTVSIGATLIRFEDTLTSLLRRSDQHMYRSKLDGRNRVTYDDVLRGEEARRVE